MSFTSRVDAILAKHPDLPVAAAIAAAANEEAHPTTDVSYVTDKAGRVVPVPRVR